MMEIQPMPTVVTADGWRRSCLIIEGASDSDHELWWEYPSIVPQLEPDDCDSYLLAALMPAMKRGSDIMVRGSVSRDLLANLTELQKVWRKWCPDLYQEVSIKADVIRDDDEPVKGAVIAFSGGADAQFTAYRHMTGLAGHSRRSLSAGVFVHGFDIPLADDEGFSGAADRARSALLDLGVKLITVRTNIRELSSVNWEHYCGTALASALGGVKSIAGIGLISSGEPYDRLVIPWGSHPMTNPLLSSSSFRIIHDGAGYSRSEKISVLSAWDVGMHHLRVCWSGDLHDRNCGKCEKCVRTRLNFLLAGVSQPACFSSPLRRDSLKTVVLRSDAARAEWELIRDEMARTGIGVDLLPEVDKVLRRPATRWGWLLPAGSRRRATAKRILGKASS